MINFKLFNCIVILIVLVFMNAGTANALRQAPGTEPLQPPPTNATPNYSGSIQSGIGAEEAEQNNQKSPFQPDDFDETNDSQPNSQTVNNVADEPRGAGDLFSIFAGVVIVLVSAGIATVYYLYRTGRLESK